MTKFWLKVQIGRGGQCWEWLASKNRKGYGKLGNELAHRVSWRLHFGEVPDGLFVCHRCDNPGCVNPSHLFLGTAQDNVDDMTRKGRARRPGKLGSKNGRSKLQETDIVNIRALVAQGSTHAEVGSRYGVHDGTISKIACGRSWRHVPYEAV